MTGFLKQTNFYCSLSAHCLKSVKQKMVKFLAQSTYSREASSGRWAGSQVYIYSQQNSERSFRPVLIHYCLGKKEKRKKKKSLQSLSCSGLSLKSPS